MHNLRLRGAFVACVATALVASASTAAPAATASGDEGVSIQAASSTFPLADPDTVLAEDNVFVTYGTTVPAGRGARCGATGKLYMPVLVHGSGSTVGMTNCASFDALPSGPGAWAEPGGAIWAPGVARWGDRFFMFYTATRKGSSQKCIGRAISTRARGPFQNQGEWACPGGGRWALDANPVVGGAGNMYVSYRDDAITSGAETGISAVRTDIEGRAIWDTRRDLLKSTDITWDTAKISGGTHVVENPAMWKSADGNWFLTYSGNNWDSARYATGIANCGPTPVPATRCTPVYQGVSRPYFGFTGAAGINPISGLPGNHQGPGGMDVFKAADGTHRVVWHWWDGSSRFPMTAILNRTSTGFLVS